MNLQRVKIKLNLVVPLALVGHERRAVLILRFAVQARMPFYLVVWQLLAVPADSPRQVLYRYSPEIHPVVCFGPDAEKLLFLVTEPNKRDLNFILVLLFRILGA